MKNFLIFGLALIFVSNSNITTAGNNGSNANAKDADIKFANGNYKAALPDYLSLLAKEPKNFKYIYNAALCYLNSNIDKSKALPLLQQLIEEGKYEPDALFLLGKAYHYSSRFDEAIKVFTDFKEKGKGSGDYLKDVDHQIKYCLNAKELVNVPVDVTFENLGKNINTEYSDYNPFLPEDESFILFSSKRAGAGTIMDLNGIYTSDIFISKSMEGSFQKAKTIGPPVNTGDGDEEVVGLSSSGETMLMYYDNMAAFGDLYICGSDKSKNFKKPELLDENVNSKAVESAGSISCNGNLLFFASDRSGGFGGTDIYVSQKLPSGSWGPALNLGEEINTEYDEDFPNISADEKTLYFSSKGHNSMGGFDIFKIEMEGEKWKDLVNLGYPINTAEDNINLRLNKTGRYGYISALREEGHGDLDIYRITFNSVNPEFTVIKGLVASIDTSKKILSSSVSISVRNSLTKQVYGNYIPSKSGHFVLALPPASYEFTIESSGFEPFKENLRIFSRNQFKEEAEKEISLVPIGYHPPAPKINKTSK